MNYTSDDEMKCLIDTTKMIVSNYQDYFNDDYLCEYYV